MKSLLSVLLVGGLLLTMVGTGHATPYPSGAHIEMNGIEYSNFSGPDTYLRWFSEGDFVHTYWSNTWIEYTAYLDPGNWNIGINQINHGMLGEDGWYTAFEVRNNLTKTVITVPTSDTEVNASYFNLDIATAALTTVRYTWLNDKWSGIPGGLDANLQITSAFFDNTATPIPTPEPSTLILLGAGLAGLVIIRKKHRKD